MPKNYADYAPPTLLMPGLSRDKHQVGISRWSFFQMFCNGLIIMMIIQFKLNYAKITQKLRNVLGNAPFYQKLRKLRKNYANYTSVKKLRRLLLG